VLAVFAYGCYAHTEGHHWAMLAAYLSLLVFGLSTLLFVSWRGWHGRFIDYRGLAEGLRVAVYWRIAGLAGDLVDRYPANLTGEVEWVRMTLRGETARSEPEDPGKAHTADALAYVIREWVSRQASYFKNTGKVDAGKEHRCRRLLEATLVISAVVAVALLVDTLFKRASFCKYLCPIGQFNFIASTASPLEVKVRDPRVCASCSGKDCICSP